MNRRKKTIYAAILILGGFALLSDRLLFGPPLNQAIATGRSLSDLGIESLAKPDVSLAATPFPKLSSVDDDDGTLLRDVFVPSPVAQEALFKTGLDSNTTDGSRSDRAIAATPETFQQNHKLNAVMVGSDVVMAVVDNQWLKVGDTLDECALIRIDGSGVTFQCESFVATLSVNPTKNVSRR